VLVACAAGAAAVACTEIGTDPNVPVAIELDATRVPALVVGDSLRDSTGMAIPLQARALNFRNEVIPDAPITFLALDTGVIALDPATGFVVGTDTGQVDVIATLESGLQSERIPVRVTLRPDTVIAIDSLRHSFQYVLADDNLDTLRVSVGHDTTLGLPGDALVPVPLYLVRFTIVDPAVPPSGDTTQVLMVNDSRQPSTIDTTDATGVARRWIRLSPAVQTIPDSVIVEASAVLPSSAPVPGSPIRFTAVLTPRATP
jgi:hypothetical protein